MSQLSLLDYTPPLEPAPAKAKITAPIATPPQPQAAKPDTAAPICNEVPFAIGDRVHSLPRPTAAKGTGITTAFAGYVGIVVRIDEPEKRCWVHYGVPNHPSPESWKYLQKSDRAAYLWPGLSLITWQEWRWHAPRWTYTGNMGIERWQPGRNAELFPVGIDPNRIGVKP